MMYNYPFFKFPHFVGYNIYRPSYNTYQKSNLGSSLNYNSNKAFASNSNSNTSSGCNLSSMYKTDLQNDDDNSKVLFEIFGLKLYYDDILLICLIFFLYKEGVHDEYLFFSLILLLIS